MLRIASEYSGYTKNVHIGLYAYFINVSNTGYDPNLEIMVRTVCNFPLCVVSGDEPLKNKKELSELCKGVQKNNPETQMIIRTKGYIYPSGLTSLKNVGYEVELPLKKSGINYNDRINEKTVNWFSKQGAKFIMDVHDDDDLDEIDQLKGIVNIKSSQIYINIKNTDKFDEYVRRAYHKGYNIYISMEGSLLQ